MAPMLLSGMLCFLLTLLPPPASSKSIKNPADELAVLINRNLTSSKLPQLQDNPGLACLALQYIQAYQGKCDDVVSSSGKRPAEAAFSSSFADSCGVEPSSVSSITGTVLACDGEYRDANYAFSRLLFKEAQTVSTLKGGNHTEFGVGISGYEGGAPYFWCVLFADAPVSSTFKFVGKEAKYQKTGCFSGTGHPCSAAVRSFPLPLLLLLLALLLLQVPQFFS